MATLDGSPAIRQLQFALYQYTHELKQLNVPDLLTIDNTTNTNTNPYITQLKLTRLSRELPYLLRDLNKFKSSKNYQQLYQDASKLITSIDEKSYLVNRALSQYVTANTQPASQPDIDSPETVEASREEKTPVDEEESLQQLRQRLTSDNSYTNYTSSSSSSNDYHESIQSDLLQDLTSLTSALKQGAMQLSSKILEDNQILSTTSTNMYQNESLMTSVGHNLNNYVMDKSGGKISFWFMLKVMVGAFVAFFIMIILTRLPKM